MRICWDCLMSWTASATVLYCNNLSRFRSLYWILKEYFHAEEGKTYWCDIATRRKYNMVFGRLSCNSGHCTHKELAHNLATQQIGIYQFNTKGFQELWYWNAAWPDIFVYECRGTWCTHVLFLDGVRIDMIQALTAFFQEMYHLLDFLLCPCLHFSWSERF